ncbi:hypothetical protein D3C86_1558150 [compost metagenome]
MQRQAIDILGGQQHRQHTRAGHALFDELSGFVGGDWSRFTTAATVNFADMFDHPDLHWHDVQLLAGFFTDGVFAATAGTGQFVFRQFVDDFDTRQFSRQRLAFATARGRCNDFFFGIDDERYRLAFRLVEQRQLRRVGLDGLFGFTSEQAVAQQLDLFFQIDDVGLVGLSHFLLTAECFKQHLLEQNRIVWKIVGHESHARIIPGQVTKRGVRT